MMRISFCGCQGTFGKTMHCLNIGMALIRTGKKVLFIDLDAQACLTKCLCDNIDGKLTILDVMGKGIEVEEALSHSEAKGCDYIPADIGLAFFSLYYKLASLRHNFLGDSLKKMEDKYDYVLIDSPPSLDLSGITAIMSANLLIMPTIPEFFKFQHDFSLNLTKVLSKYELENKFKRYYLLNATDAWSTDDIPVVQDLKMEMNEGYFNTAFMRKEELANVFSENKDVFASDAEDCISAYIKLVEEINGIKD